MMENKYFYENRSTEKFVVGKPAIAPFINPKL